MKITTEINIYYITAQEGKKSYCLETTEFVHSIIFLLWKFHQFILIITSVIEASNSKTKLYASQIKYILVNLHL